MELLGLEVSEYGVSFTSYFGDVYINTRTFLFVAVIVVALRVAKLIRKRNNERKEFALSSDPSIWEN